MDKVRTRRRRGMRTGRRNRAWYRETEGKEGERRGKEGIERKTRKAQEI